MSEVNSLRVHSVNAGLVRDLASLSEPVPSGIDKQPLADGALVNADGIQSDQIADTRYHGGPDQAVYVYSVQDYAWWSTELEVDLPPGIFGENLTLDGMPSDPAIGDRLISGTLVLEVTGPRIPCHKLGLVMGDIAFPQRFRDAQRPGAYCRVLSAGVIRPGDSVIFVRNPDGRMTVGEMFRLYYQKPSRAEDLRLALTTPLASRLQRKFEARLVRASAD